MIKSQRTSQLVIARPRNERAEAIYLINQPILLSEIERLSPNQSHFPLHQKTNN